jgi:NADH-quinone oxidoreductase subunit C
MMPTESTLKRIEDHFGNGTVQVSVFRDNTRLTCAAQQIGELLQFLKTECGMDMLVDITAVDYQEYPDARDRYGVIYMLAGTATGERLVVKVYLNDPTPSLPSAVPLWNGANWLEREVYDMFGIRFDGHPDLRRILLPEEFTAFPLRKDYPLRGRGERHNFPVLTRTDS